ncbi:MAG: energy transducer TonB [Thermodesulfobacteriota bacterium]|nr:energy transducer TonB [Thermodesulfobacteriota bacterium]
MLEKNLVIAAVIAFAIHCVVVFVYIPDRFTLPEICKNKPLEISFVSAYKRFTEESGAEVHETTKKKNKACCSEPLVLKKQARKQVIKVERVKTKKDIPAAKRTEHDIFREVASVKMPRALPTLHAMHNKARRSERIDMVPAMPCYKSNPPPEYPAIARRRGHEGGVLIAAMISAYGNVVELKIKESSGHHVLDQAAMKAVEEWEFKPARRMGIPVSMLVDVPVRFVLKHP